jgi:ferrous iron transport protein B
MTPSAAPLTPRRPARRIAVAGNPNSGKTTLFNALTGLRHKVGNYPGVTVEKREGPLPGSSVTLIDLPGTYGLSARSPDEEVARDVLLGRVEKTPRPDGVLLVIDANNLERNLYLALQILDFGMPVVVACNMMDVAAGRGVVIDCEALAAELGVPVFPAVADRGQGVDDIRGALENLNGHRPPPRRWRLPAPYESAIERAAAALRKSGATPSHAAAGGALLWLCDYLSGEVASRKSAEKWLARLPAGCADELRGAAAEVQGCCDDAASAAIEARYAWITQMACRVRRDAAKPERAERRVSSTVTDRIDSVLTHRLWGPVAFAGVVFLVFLSIFAGAEPLMHLIESGRAALGRWVGSMFSEGPLRSLVVDGIITGAGAVVIFFPQICLLFLYVAILEDSGYMARAAFIMDRLMSRAGLHGKSFIPLISCYACAVPGILATRSIENKRDRFTTMLVAPLISCSARLPVYLILVGAVFANRTWLKAVTMFSLYLLGTVVALAMARVFKKTIFAGPQPAFIMELPPYHLPRPWSILRVMWDRSKVFLTDAGTIIFAGCVIVWALSYFPHIHEAELSPETKARIAALSSDQGQARDNLIAAERLHRSCLGRLGHAIEPVIRPLGYDWRIGVGVVSSFMAREVFVGTMGITFAIGQTNEHSADLRAELAAATWPDGRRVLTPLVGVGLMIFYVLACQCISTLAVVRKETHSLRWPAFLFAYMLAMAYTAALLVYQVGTALGLGGS